MKQLLQRFQYAGFRFFLLSLVLLLVIKFLHLQAGTAVPILLVWILSWLVWYRGNLFGLLGYRYHIAGNIPRAERFYRSAFKMGCRMESIQLAYGMLHLRQGQLEEAERLFDDLVKKSRKDNYIHAAQTDLVLVYWKKGNLDKAIETAEQLLPVYRNTGLYVDLGYFYLLEGKLDKAEAINREALEFSPSNAGVLDNAGLLHAARGELDQAEETFRKALDINPESADTHYNLANLLRIRDRLKEALDEYEKSRSCMITFLSSVTREQIEKAIREVREKLETDDKK